MRAAALSGARAARQPSSRTSQPPRSRSVCLAAASSSAQGAGGGQQRQGDGRGFQLRPDRGCGGSSADAEWATWASLPQELDRLTEGEAIQIFLPPRIWRARLACTAPPVEQAIAAEHAAARAIVQRLLEQHHSSALRAVALTHLETMPSIQQELMDVLLYAKHTWLPQDGGGAGLVDCDESMAMALAYSVAAQVCMLYSLACAAQLLLAAHHNTLSPHPFSTDEL